MKLAVLGLAAWVALGTLSNAEGIRGTPVYGPSGLHTQPWFQETFLELGDDLAGAAAQGKRFVVIWEQRGCPYCRETHLLNLAQPEIRDYIKANFHIVQLNKRGDREVTDFDGEKLSEKALARKWRVVFTPTVMFFPAQKEAIASRAPNNPDVIRMTGYYRPFHFLAMFRYVRENAYGHGPFRKYVAALRRAREKSGLPIRFE